MDIIEKYFKNLRFDENHHLGLGDIRLTIAQQDEIVGMHLTAIEEKDKEIERLRSLLVELDSVIRTTHLDMGGQHRYALVGGNRVGVVIGMLKEELAIEEDSDDTTMENVVRTCS